MAYALDDGEGVFISTHQIAWRNNVADLDPSGFDSFLDYSQLDVMCGGTRRAMAIGVCYPIHVVVGECAAVDLRGVLPINAARMADLSADMFHLGVCDGGD